MVSEVTDRFGHEQFANRMESNPRLYNIGLGLGVEPDTTTAIPDST